MYFPIFRANLAVVSILRSAHVAAQQRVDMRAVRAQWSRYGLRDGDLERSVDRLESLGFVDVDRAHGHRYLTLTDLGRRSAYSTIGWLESLALVPRRTAHLLAQFRVWSTGDRLTRRSGDRGRLRPPTHRNTRVPHRSARHLVEP